MPILLHVLHQDRQDPVLTKAILDTLINLCGESGSSFEEESPDNSVRSVRLYLSLLTTLLAEEVCCGKSS